MSRRKKDANETPASEAQAATAVENPPDQVVAPESPPSPSENGDRKAPLWKLSAPVSRTEYVNCTVWENEVANNGHPFTVYAVQLEVRYKVGEEWRTGRSLRGSMVPLACWLLGRAYDFVMGLRSGNVPS